VESPGIGSWPQCRRKKRKEALHKPNSQIRMTNDEIRRNTEIRMTNPAIAPLRALRHSGFGFLSSLVIGHWSFNDLFETSSWSQFMRKNQWTLSMSRRGHREAACLGKAALKTHALQTLRDCRASPNRAKRLECVRLIGAFPLPAYWYLEATDVPFAPADFR